MALTYEPIATTTLGSNSSTITFSSIPSTYTDLRLVIFGLITSSGGGYNIKYNNDSSALYSFTYLTGSGTSASSARFTNYSYFSVDGDNGMGAVAQNNLVTVDIFSYAGSTNKTALGTIAGDRNGAGSVFQTVGLWRNTAAINRIDLTGTTFATGSTFTLYGIKSA